MDIGGSWSLCVTGDSCECVLGQLGGICLIVWVGITAAIALLGCGCYYCTNG
eukprot:g16175.t1